MGRKFSNEFERDYKFYYDNRATFDFCGSDIKKDFGIQLPSEQESEVEEDGIIKIVPYPIPYSLNGKSAKICFHKLDGAGKRIPCSEPELLIEILRCKGAVNLNIKTWAQSLAEGTIFVPELQEYMQHFNCPEWVFKSIKHQADRLRYGKQRIL